MVQNNAINQYSQRLAVGITATSSDVSDITPFTVRYDQNATTSIAISNMTAGNAALAGMSIQANSGHGFAYMYDDGHSLGWAAGRFVVNSNENSAGLTLGFSSDDSQTLNVVDTATGTAPWSMSTASERTMVSQPAFLAYNSVTDADVTGDGTAVTVDFNTEVFDQSSDFATDTFTAPVAGRYLFESSVTYADLGAGHTQVILYIATSNRNYTIGEINGAAARDSGNFLTVSGGAIADMDAADTAFIQAYAINSTKTVDILGGVGAATYFSGSLLL